MQLPHTVHIMTKCMNSYVYAYITICHNDLYMAMQDYRMTDNHVARLPEPSFDYTFCYATSSVQACTNISLLV